MKRVMLTVITALSATLLVLIAVPINAQDNDIQAGVPLMARYYLDDTFMFAAMRLDADYVDQLNRLVNRVSSSFSSVNVPQIDLREMLSMMTGGSDVFEWLGDYAAFGYSGDMVALLGGTASSSGLPEGITAYGVVELRDADAATAFLTQSLNWRNTITQIGDTQFPTFVNVDGTTLVVTPAAAYLLPPDQPFESAHADGPTTFIDSVNYTTVMEQLPADGYNAVIYIDAGFFAYTFQTLTTISSSQAMFKPVPEAAAAQDLIQSPAVPSIPMAFGLTILNNDTLTIDMATMSGATPADAVDPEFLRFLPANTGAVVQATNLTSLIDNALLPAVDALNQASGTTSGPSTEQRLEMIFQMIGLDLRQDVLSWTTGDYALFARADTVEIARSVIANKIDVNGLYDFGLIMEATDPALAAAFTSRMTDLLTQAASGSPSDQLIISQRTFGDTEATVFELHIPSDQMFGSTTEAETIVLPITIGANDDVFFITTADAAEAMFGGDGGSSLMDMSAYQDATTYLLPNPTSVWYTSGEGFLLGTAGNPITVVTGLALLGPSIGNIFDNIVAELNGTPMPQPTATPTPTPVPTLTAAQIEDQVAPLIALNNLIRSSTISSTITEDGATVIRMTISLNIGD